MQARLARRTVRLKESSGLICGKMPIVHSYRLLVVIRREREGWRCVVARPVIQSVHVPNADRRGTVMGFRMRRLRCRRLWGEPVTTVPWRRRDVGCCLRPCYEEIP